MRQPTLIGKKYSNFLPSSAVLYSHIETAKANGLVPYDYIVHGLEHLCANPDDIEPLLPWNVSLNV
ncbi:hypothetical protein C9J12_20990 [Photobacterium frigidiphilum]|uniref:Transposase IS66 C-terminal domain-containing protein n=1 Tax=Photobacterium frigidiphilum TaxID=264736 RepID=A0A2T3JA77_9GAMM|nr:hypothetical protein C9J12_20990 [Photobacterium frigidiphilum]